MGTQRCAHGVPDQDALDALVDMREFDVPYHMRFQIDTDVRCGHWFTVRAKVRTAALPCSLLPASARRRAPLTLTLTLVRRPHLSLINNRSLACRALVCRN